MSDSLGSARSSYQASTCYKSAADYSGSGSFQGGWAGWTGFHSRSFYDAFLSFFEYLFQKLLWDEVENSDSEDSLLALGSLFLWV